MLYFLAAIVVILMIILVCVGGSERHSPYTYIEYRRVPPPVKPMIRVLTKADSVQGASAAVHDKKMSSAGK